MKLNRKIAALGLVFFFVTWAVSFTAAAKTEPAKEQVLRFAEAAADAGTLNVNTSGLAQDLVIYDLVYDKLFEFPKKGLPSPEVVSHVAESWDVSDNFTVFTVHLRKGIKWHKGYGELTADDVKYSLDLRRDPKLSSFAHGEDVRFIKAVKKIDNYTVQVILKSPLPGWPIEVAVSRGVVCKKYIEEKGDAAWTSPIGTGPFIFEAYQPNDRIVLVRNENYWKGAPILEKFELIFMPSLASRESALRRSEVDVIKGAYDSMWLKKMSKLGFTVDVLGPGIAGLFEFNMTIKPLDDWRVRAAIAYAMDREELVLAFGEMLASAQLSPVPEAFVYGIKGYQGIAPYKCDPEKAKALLAAAGYPKGFSLKVYSSERDRYLTQYTIIQNQLKKVGITLDIVTVDHTTFHAKGKANENPLMAYGRLGPTASFLSNFYLSSGAMGGKSPTYNYANYKNPEIDKLLETVGSLPVKAQAAIYAKVQRQLLVDLATYPTVHLRMPSVRAPYVDLGGQAEGTTTGSPIFTIKTQILAH